MYRNKFLDRSLESFEEYEIDDHEKLFNNFRNNQSETLVIHPDDPTTCFLSKIYKGKGFNVIDDPFTGNDTIAELIKDHKRIIALGHGCEFGLYGGFEMMINSSLVPLLMDKELIFIWCNADQFVQKHGLNGFYTGMFLSECTEADLFGIPYDDELQIEMSNDWFASILGKHINSDNILKNVKQEYHDHDNSIVSFNRDRLYSNI